MDVLYVYMQVASDGGKHSRISALYTVRRENRAKKVSHTNHRLKM